MHISTTRDICAELIDHAYSLTRAGELFLSPEAAHAWQQLQGDYENLPLDAYLPGGAKYRFRRYGRAYFQPDTGELIQLPHQDFYQPVEHNKVTGGVVRKFAPLLPERFNNLFMQELIRFNFAHFPMNDEQRGKPWVVAIHEIRVVADQNTLGEPTPEGIHRDGAEFVTVHLAEFENVEGGEVTIYDNEENALAQFALKDVLDSYFFADNRVLHSAGKIRCVEPGKRGVRSILTFDYHYSPDFTQS